MISDTSCVREGTRNCYNFPLTYTSLPHSHTLYQTPHTHHQLPRTHIHVYSPRDTTPRRKVLGQFPGKRGRGKGPKQDGKLFMPYKRPDRTRLCFETRPAFLPSPVVSGVPPLQPPARLQTWTCTKFILRRIAELVSQLEKEVNKTAYSYVSGVNGQCASQDGAPSALSTPCPSAYVLPCMQSLFKHYLPGTVPPYEGGDV